jgi:uncharacterized protein YjbI with pentapeptide repeats
MKSKDTSRRVPRIDDKALTTWSTLEDEDELVDVVLDGDFSGVDLSHIALQQARLGGVTFTGTRLVRTTFIDCVIFDSEFSGAVFEECRFERVEFRRCRMSGLQAQGSRFTDVAMVDCKLDGANFRMTAWERAELRDCNLADADFYSAQLPGSIVQGCDLTNVELSKCGLAGSRLHGSRFEAVRGADALRGVVIGSDQLIPTALAVFGALGIRVEDAEEDASSRDAR